MFFLAFVPLFAYPARSAPWVQMLILGPLLPLISVPVFAAAPIAGAARIADRLRASSAGRWLDGAAGTLFLGLQAQLAGAPR